MGKAFIWLGKKIISFNNKCKCIWNGMLDKITFACDCKKQKHEEN